MTTYTNTLVAIENAIDLLIFVRTHVLVDLADYFHPIRKEVLDQLEEMKNLWISNKWSDELTSELRSLKGSIAQNKAQLFKIARERGYTYDKSVNSFYNDGREYCEYTWDTYYLEYGDREEHDSDLVRAEIQYLDDTKFCALVMSGALDDPDLNC